jgi:uncharacterized membrane protein YeaQ/YmgE (transglycosylase-associated protein family)
MNLLIILLVGALAGWIAGSIVRSENNSFLLDIVIGIVGGWLGYKLFGHQLNITHSRFINEVLTATAGATILALGVKIVRKIF